jgi:plastocyanin
VRPLRPTGLATGFGLLALTVFVLLGSGGKQATSGPLACGQYSAPGPTQAAPTPQIAPPSNSSLTPVRPVTVVGTWSTCFRPKVVRVQAGGVVQWQEVSPERVDIILDNGVELGPVLHVLEVRFNRPGRYLYHAQADHGATGTVIVEGSRKPGAALTIWSTGSQREVGPTEWLAR